MHAYKLTYTRIFDGKTQIINDKNKEKSMNRYTRKFKIFIGDLVEKLRLWYNFIPESINKRHLILLIKECVDNYHRVCQQWRAWNLIAG